MSVTLSGEDAGLLIAYRQRLLNLREDTAALEADRDRLVRHLLGTGIPAVDLIDATGLSKARIYQIKADQT